MSTVYCLHLLSMNLRPLQFLFQKIILKLSQFYNFKAKLKAILKAIFKAKLKAILKAIFKYSKLYSKLYSKSSRSFDNESFSSYQELSGVQRLYSISVLLPSKCLLPLYFVYFISKKKKLYFGPVIFSSVTDVLETILLFGYLCSLQSQPESISETLRF